MLKEKKRADFNNALLQSLTAKLAKSVVQVSSAYAPFAQPVDLVTGSSQGFAFSLQVEHEQELFQTVRQKQPAEALYSESDALFFGGNGTICERQFLKHALGEFLAKMVCFAKNFNGFFKTTRIL